MISVGEAFVQPLESEFLLGRQNRYPCSAMIRTTVLLDLFCLSALLALPLQAQPSTTLKPETIKEFDQYAKSVELAVQQRIQGQKPFLWMDEDPRQRTEVRTGEILLHQFDGDPVKIDDGLVHDWIGAMFIPGVELETVVDFLLSYDRHVDIYPEVLEAELLEKNDNVVRSRMRTSKKKVLTVVLDMELETRIESVSDQRTLLRSYSTRISEVKDAGTPEEKVLPDGEGTGFLWRLYSYWRLEEADDGVFAELETLSLTRGIPAGLGFVIKPFIRNVPRESITSTLQATRLALTQ